ncbi:MAG: hypothetical protein FWF44_10845, partial [Defluviitaleaceae bacterium]|nr:hypothetical protein [Defluviitaleaceae bacterium]
PIDVKSADFKAQFYDKISKAKIMEFYLKHPGRLWESMKIEAGWSKAIRPGYLANYLDPSSPGQQSRRFSLWETARGKIGVSNIWVILAVFALTAGVIAAEISAGIKNRRERLRRMPTYRDNFAFAAFLTALLLCAAYNFVIPYLTNGICDIAKHMFGFVALYDLILVILAGYAARMGRKLIRRLHRRNY